MGDLQLLEIVKKGTNNSSTLCFVTWWLPFTDLRIDQAFRIITLQI